MANDVLGYVACNNAGCNEKAAVFQAKRNGAHLYCRCPSCGLNQQTGDKFQNYLYYQTDWKDGAPTAPVNIGEPPAVKDVEEEPVTVESTEQSTVKKSVKTTVKKRVVWKVVAVIGAVALIVVGAGVKTA